MYKIITKEQLNSETYSMKIHAPKVALNALAGHFVILRINEFGERIPLTIVSVDKINGLIEIIFQTIGFTTKLLALKNVGDEILDFVGPLGKAKEVKENRKVLGIAGGVGAAPLLMQLTAYQPVSKKIDVIIGARNKDVIILEERIRECSNQVFITTNDGSRGHGGYVTDLLEKIITEYDLIFAIGPAIMMKNVVEIAKKYQVETIVSLNPIMIDGTGMCGECRVTVNNKIQFACIDGPEFDGFAVDFDELMARQKIYQKEEHLCQIEEGKNYE